MFEIAKRSMIYGSNKNPFNFCIIAKDTACSITAYCWRNPQLIQLTVAAIYY